MRVYKMRFCRQCDTRLTKTPSPNGTIVFRCLCSLPAVGGPDDTLMYERDLRHTLEDTEIHSVFIDNAPYDHAANTVLQDCPDCGLDFMTVAVVGQNKTAQYRCVNCDLTISHSDYLRRAKK